MDRTPTSPETRLSGGWAGVAVVSGLLAVAVGTGIWQAVSARNQSPATAQPPQPPGVCLDPGYGMEPPPAPDRVQVLESHKDGSWSRLYVSRQQNWLTVCTGTSDRADRSFGTVLDGGPTPAGEPIAGIHFAGDLDAVVKAGHRGAASSWRQIDRARGRGWATMC